MRILLIEDDPDIADLVRRGLSARHYVVDVAHDGEAGSELAWSNEYDLMIMDIHMPKMDGRTLCRSLRAEKITTPILMLTAMSGREDIIAGLDDGADDYLTKPFDFGVLLARVRALTRRGSEQRTALIQVADLTIDTARRTVERGGRQISLTSKEFALLEYLALNEGKIVTRTEISEHVWDSNFDPKSNVIESLISYLRQSIDKEYEVRLIHTIRGAGYRFGPYDGERH